MSVLIQVRAVPADDNHATIECSDCGPIGVVNTADVDRVCISHLELHNVDVSGYQ